MGLKFNNNQSLKALHKIKKQKQKIRSNNLGFFYVFQNYKILLIQELKFHIT